MLTGLFMPMGISPITRKQPSGIEKKTCRLCVMVAVSGYAGAQRIPKDPKSAWGHPMMLTYSCRGRLGPTNCFPRYQEPSFLRWLTRNTHPWTSSKYLFLFLLINLPEHIGKFANMLHQSIRMFIPRGIYHHITKSRLATESKASLKPRNLSPSNLNKLRHLKVKSWNRDMLYVGWFL